MGISLFPAGDRTVHLFKNEFSKAAYIVKGHGFPPCHPAGMTGPVGTFENIAGPDLSLQGGCYIGIFPEKFQGDLQSCIPHSVFRFFRKDDFPGQGGEAFDLPQIFRGDPFGIFDIHGSGNSVEKQCSETVHFKIEVAIASVRHKEKFHAAVQTHHSVILQMYCPHIAFPDLAENI